MVTKAQIEYALRRMRPDCYHLSDSEPFTLTLVMRASEPGRRNGADRIVTQLCQHGLELAAEDPVTALTQDDAVLQVQPKAVLTIVDEGGDAACWANKVCPECGRLNEAAHPLTCEACGATFD